MDYSKKLEEIIESNYGIISSKMVTDAEVPRVYLSKFVKEKKLERCERGIYMATNVKNDKMFTFQLRYTQTVFSHESALFLHHYTEKMPKELAVTVKTGTNTKTLVSTGSKVFSIRADLFELGEIQMETCFGRKVNTYNIERSICDIIRSRNKMNNAFILDTLKRYNNSSEKDFMKLFSYAKKMNVAKILNTYYEFIQ